jgi:hypothetical protein
VVSGHNVTLGLDLAAFLWVVNPLYATVFQVSSLQIALSLMVDFRSTIFLLIFPYSSSLVNFDEVTSPTQADS